MSAQRRLTLVMGISLLLAVASWAAVLPGLVTASTALWLTLAVGLCGFVAAKFNRHAELPDSVKLH
jgi:hypothetical protein